MRKAVYAGSFDPITNGHLWMVEEGARLFDELVVAVGVNPDKRAEFDVTERLEMIKASLAEHPGVGVESFENRYLVDYAASLGAQYVLRGIRSQSDYEFECGMRRVNEDLKPEVTTVFLIPPREIAEVSSSLVRGLIGPQGWQQVVRGYVPPPVFEVLVERYGRGKS